MARENRIIKMLVNAAYPLVVALLAWGAWEWAAIAAGSEFIVPRPENALKAFGSVLASGETYLLLAGTVGRTVLSFLLSLVPALAAALLSTAFRPLAKLLSPIVSTLRALPTMAVVLLLVIWTGHENAPLFVALLVIMPTLYSALLSALGGIDRDTLDMARLDGASKAVLLLRFRLPLALPAAVGPVSSSLSLTLKLIVAAEVLAGTFRSLGAAMQMANIYFETARLMAYTLLTVIIGILLEKLIFALLSLLSHKIS